MRLLKDYFPRNALCAIATGLVVITLLYFNERRIERALHSLTAKVADINGNNDGYTQEDEWERVYDDLGIKYDGSRSLKTSQYEEYLRKHQKVVCQVLHEAALRKEDTSRYNRVLKRIIN